MGQSHLGFLARGDVGRDADQLQGAAVGSALGDLGVFLHPGIAAVTPPHPVLDAARWRLLAAPRAREQAAKARAVARVNQLDNLGRGDGRERSPAQPSRAQQIAS